MANIKRILAVFLTAMLIMAMSVSAFAATSSKTGGSTGNATVHTTSGTSTESAALYTNPDTNYGAYIEDDADLLTSTQERELLDYMWQITNYGNVVFKTIDYNPKNSTVNYANDYYYNRFGNTNGTVFIIDMDERNLWIVSAGSVYNIVTKARANTITDNSYRYASDGDYLGCAEQTFWQIYQILEGNEIAQPMKHVTNVLMAIMIALVINFIIILRAASIHKTSNRQLIQAAEAAFSKTPTEAVFLNETKTYSPVQTSSGGGGGGGHSGGGGGGGGFSGGGGGHSF